MTLEDFDDGQRIELIDSVATADRFGTVVKVGRRALHVHFDLSNNVRLIAPRFVGTVFGRGISV